MSYKNNGFSENKQEVVSITYEEIGLFPRSFSRVLDRFLKQIFSDVENLVIQEYRFYRYLFLTTLKCLLILFFVPFFVNFLAKTYVVRPLTEYFWNTKQAEIFLNSYQQKRAFSELKEFEEKTYFESLIFPKSALTPNLNMLFTVSPNGLASHSPFPTYGREEAVRVAKPNHLREGGSCFANPLGGGTKQDPASVLEKPTPFTLRVRSKSSKEGQGGIPKEEASPSLRSLVSPPNNGGLASNPKGKGREPNISPTQRGTPSFLEAKNLASSFGIPPYTPPVMGGGSPLEGEAFAKQRLLSSCLPLPPTGVRESRGDSSPLPNGPFDTVREEAVRPLNEQKEIIEKKTKTNLLLSHKQENEQQLDIFDGTDFYISHEGVSTLVQPPHDFVKARTDLSKDTMGLHQSAYPLMTYGNSRTFYTKQKIDEFKQTELLINSYKMKSSLFFYQTQEASKNMQQRYQEKTIELAQRYNAQSIEAITNFFADLISLFTLFYLLYVLEIQINITKSFLLEVFFGLDDSKKSLLILLITDLLVGYHSSNLWELFFEFFFHHYGLPESQTGIFLLVATLPVLLDVLFKYLIFRHLNRSSPATVATYHAMIE